MLKPNQIDAAVKPTSTGCQECEASHGWWFHLRRCAPCGHIGCCDTSPSQHATKHFQSTGHEVIQSFEPGENWFWDFKTAETFDGPSLAAPHAHPSSQTVPGPNGRVPANWQDLLNE